MKKVAFIFRENNLFNAFIQVIISAFEKVGYEVSLKTFTAGIDVPKDEVASWLDTCTAELIFSDKTCKKLYYHDEARFKKLSVARHLDYMFEKPMEKFIHMPKGVVNFEAGLRFLIPYLDLTKIKKIYLVQKNLADHVTLFQGDEKIEDWKGKRDELNSMTSLRIQSLFSKIFPWVEDITLVEYVKGMIASEEDMLLVLDRHHEVAQYIMREMTPEEFNAQAKSQVLILPVISHIQFAEYLGQKLATEKLLTNESVLESFKEFLD